MVEGPRTILMTKCSESKMVHREKPTGSQVAGSLRGLFLEHGPPDGGAQWTEVGKMPLQTLLPKMVLTCSRRSEGSEV